MKQKTISLALALSCLLGIHRGCVALWKWEDPEPIVVTDTPAELLPPEDYEALSRGILIPDGVNPAGVLENFCS